MAKVEGAVPQRRTKRVRAPAPAVEVVKTHFSSEDCPASVPPRAWVAVAVGAEEAAQATPRVWEPYADSSVPQEAVVLLKLTAVPMMLLHPQTLVEVHAPVSGLDLVPPVCKLHKEGSPPPCPCDGGNS